jgi:hypothetical protein
MPPGPLQLLPIIEGLPHTPSCPPCMVSGVLELDQAVEANPPLHPPPLPTIQHTPGAVPSLSHADSEIAGSTFTAAAAAAVVCCGAGSVELSQQLQTLPLLQAWWWCGSCWHLLQLSLLLGAINCAPLIKHTGMMSLDEFRVAVGGLWVGIGALARTEPPRQAYGRSHAYSSSTKHAWLRRRTMAGALLSVAHELGSGCASAA